MLPAYLWVLSGWGELEKVGYWSHPGKGSLLLSSVCGMKMSGVSYTCLRIEDKVKFRGKKLGPGN